MSVPSRPLAALPRLVSRLVCGLPLAGIAAALLAPAPARTLPLFARGGNNACADCHVAVPRLNARGMRFLQNGDRPLPPETPAPVRLEDWPVSVDGALDYAVARTESQPGGASSRARIGAGSFDRSGLALASAGALAPRVSYHADAVVLHGDDFLERGRVHFQLDDLAGHGALNLRVGRFDVDLPWLASSRRTTLRDYLAPVTLDARGLELNGATGAWAWGAGLIGSHRSHDRLEDTYLWVTRGTGEARVGARMLFDRQDSNLAFHTWLQHLEAEASACFVIGRVLLIPGYTVDRYDDRPAPELHERHQVGLVEVFTPLDERARWTLTARLEHRVRTATVYTSELDQDLEALDLGIALYPNARTAIELAHQGDNVGGPRWYGADAVVRLSY